MIDQNLYWATGSNVIPCFCISQNLDDDTAIVILKNGAKHCVDTMDLCRDELEAQRRNSEKERV